ncbi:hypothetical protein GYMLUDRAFT_251376 [Collybiopsis luxurians FD-317 M1]|uniref:Uncharacterized protein n=1 Tax=Collybiopsis luxurians FD-317 M1 TaxID=944289 RepID=A0A0D0BCL6_9AGAR|nr:hypothetical protein GYMLUDRAFT_251376 [Collybiopsis luxurians FD-317 M1]
MPFDVRIEVIGYIAFVRTEIDDRDLYEARMREEAQDSIAEAEKILVQVKDCSGVAERWLSLSEVDAEHLCKFTHSEYASVKFSGVERIIQSRKTKFGDQYLVIVESDGHIIRSPAGDLIPYPVLSSWWNNNAHFRVLGYQNGNGNDEATQSRIEDAKEILIGVECGEHAREFWANPVDISLEEIEDFKHLEMDDTLDIKYAVTKILSERAHARGLGPEYLALIEHKGLEYTSWRPASLIPHGILKAYCKHMAQSSVGSKIVTADVGMAGIGTQDDPYVVDD